MLTRFPLSAVNASSVGSKGERRPSVNTADTNEVTFYMKTREYLKSLSFANPQITFAPDFEHYRIYDDFVCDRMLEEGVDHPGEYSGQASIKLVCTQHPFSLEEGMYDPRGCEKKQRAYTQEWVEYLKSEKMPVKEIHVCSAVDQIVFDALCCQDSLESLRIKWLRCKQIDDIVRLKKLKKLFLERASSLLDITPIVSLENLEVLILGETKKIIDYSALSALKKLKVLGICNYRTSINVTIKVKDLDFISEMPNLEYVDFMDVRLI